MERLFNFRRSEALSRLWIATGEQSGLLTRIAAMESVTLCVRMKS
jgi:hypothetical protein